jgi:uncharacterized protein (DUF1697 family)
MKHHSRMRYVAFLRAINVGGHIVKMDQLRKLFETLGFANVSTFIASGNVIFDAASKSAPGLEKKISSALEKALGYPVATFIRTGAEIARIAECKVFKPSELGEGSLFVCLLPDVISASEKKMIAAMETPVDALRVDQREIYWRAAQNFRDAQFSPAKMEKKLGKPATFRNVTTMRKIAAILAKP